MEAVEATLLFAIVLLSFAAIALVMNEDTASLP